MVHENSYERQENRAIRNGRHSAMVQTVPSISVIVVSWNAKKYLEQCIQSFLNCPELNAVEIIVVDNASSDGSPEFIKQNYPGVKLICNADNLGFARANNIGIKHSQGKYLFLINSDVVVYPNCIESMVDYMERHPEIGLLGPRIVGTDHKVQRSCMGYPSLWNTFCRAVLLDGIFPHVKLFSGFLMKYWAHDSIKEVDVINGCFWSVRRRAIEEVGLLDEDFFMYAEDIDWCKRFNSAGWKVVYFPLAEALHYGGASSVNAPIRFYIEMQKANLKFWGKHYGKLSRSVYLCIIFLHQSLRALGYALHYAFAPKTRDTSSYKIKRSFAAILALLSK